MCAPNPSDLKFASIVSPLDMFCLQAMASALESALHEEANSSSERRFWRPPAHQTFYPEESGFDGRSRSAADVAFDAIDRNRDGVVDRHEFRVAMEVK